MAARSGSWNWALDARTTTTKAATTAAFQPLPCPACCLPLPAAAWEGPAAPPRCMPPTTAILAVVAAVILSGFIIALIVVLVG